MKTWLIVWSPEGRPIAKVEAKDAQAAKKQTPKPYKTYLGEVYVISLEEYEATIGPCPQVYR